MAKIIYQSKRPKFCIMTNPHQWILATSFQVKSGQQRWKNRTYHPTLSLLLEELAETMFKKNAKKLKTLKELDQSIERVYQLIDSRFSNTNLSKNQ